jgi:CcmD family protein
MKWLFAAYAVIWLAVFVYLFDLAKKQKAIAREVEGLKMRLGSAEKK